MTYYLRHCLFAITALLAGVAARGQSGLTIQEGTPLYISSGTTFSVDSLVLTPSADYTITGANSLQRSSTAAQPFSNTHVQRVFRFANTLPAYSGAIGIYYRDAELAGLSENGLTLHIHNGTAWNTFAQNVTRDATNNWVNTASLSNVVLNELLLADECPTRTTWYQDSDGDGYGNAAVSQQACTQPAGYVTDNTDCNDANAQVHPGATEICNGIDDDCDGQVDEGLPQYTYYLDNDGDGYGSATTTITCSSTAPQGYASRGGDCNDANAAIHPGATEVCDGVDNNCNGQIDEGVTTTYYQDSDGDGYGNGAITMQACAQPQGYVTNNGDCNDNNAQIHPGATEVCNGVDDDCDGQTDEGVITTWYRDADGDGFGNPSNSTQACTQPDGFVANNDDCNDNNAAVRPGATEVCGNGIDDNCDGQIDEGCNNRVLINIADATVYEAGGTARVVVSLTRASTQTVTVSFKTIDGTATSRTTRNTSRDYTATSGTLTIPAGQRTAIINVPVATDNVTEGPETFTISLSRPTNAGIGNESATVTILDGIAPAITSIKAAKAAGEYMLEEGLSVKTMPNPAAHVFTVYISSSSNQPVTMQVTDMLGRVVETRNGLAANSYMRIGQQYRPGVYMLNITQGNNSITTKLIKQAN